MLCLAITWVLVLVVFLYFRYKMSQYEDRLNLLTTTIQTMAGFNFKIGKCPESEEEEEESESECESEEHAFDREWEPKTIISEPVWEPKTITLPEPVFEKGWVEPIHLEKVDEPKRNVSDDVINEVNEVNDDQEVKTIEEPVRTLEDLTVKELKEKVALVNGPKLKTKKELIDFLQNKI